MKTGCRGGIVKQIKYAVRSVVVALIQENPGRLYFDMEYLWFCDIEL